MGTSKGHLNSLDPKVLQLINTLTNKPLLIEKLILSQSQGVLLKLSSETRSLDLQLPIKMAILFKNISPNNAKLSLSVNNQQVQLQLSQTISSKTNIPLTKTVIFQTSKFLSEQILQLGQPKSQPSISPKSVNTDADFSTTRQSQIEGLPIKRQQSALSNIDTVTGKNSGSKINQHRIADSQIAASRTSASQRTSIATPNLLSSSKTSRTTPTNQITEDPITVTNAAKLILKNHFSKQLPIAKHLSNINKIANILSETTSSNPLQIKLQKQIKYLMSMIQKPVKHSAIEIKQRVENSGHLLEKNLAKQVEASTNQSTKYDLQIKSATEYPKAERLIKQKKTEKSKADKPTSIPKPIAKTLTPTNPTNDLKLQLMKIRSTLETIINPIKQPQSNQSQPPIATPTNASAEIKSIASQQQSINTAGKITTQTKAQILEQQILVKQAIELSTEVKNIISQIESNQLLSLKNDAPNLHQILIDLPLKNNTEIDSFEILFEHSETNQTGKKVKRWKVVVRFDLEPLGPMFAQVELENERVSTHFFAQSQQTAQLINQYLPLLKKSLFTAGVDIDKLEGSQGKIPERLLNDSEQLIDSHV